MKQIYKSPCNIIFFLNVSKSSRINNNQKKTRIKRKTTSEISLLLEESQCFLHLKLYLYIALYEQKKMRRENNKKKMEKWA